MEDFAGCVWITRQRLPGELVRIRRQLFQSVSSHSGVLGQRTSYKIFFAPFKKGSALFRVKERLNSKSLCPPRYVVD